MPYAMNPGHDDKMHGEYKFSSVQDCLNHIVTDFAATGMFHNTADQCTVKLDFRGLARFHQKMAERAAYHFSKLSKCVADIPFGISTMPDMREVEKAMEAAHYSEAQLMSHLDAWLKCLWDSRGLFTEAAYYLSDCHEITLYKKMCCYVDMIENELWAVGVLKDRLTPTNYNHPDAYRVFQILHLYFHDCWKLDDDIDFDL